MFDDGLSQGDLPVAGEHHPVAMAHPRTVVASICRTIASYCRPLDRARQGDIRETEARIA
jgi:hypothetical protein